MLLEENSPIRAMMRQLRARFVTEANRGRVGELVEMAPRRLLSEPAYKVREEFLRFCDQCPDEHFDREVSRTAYFLNQRRRKNTVAVRAKCRKYKALLNSMRAKYLRDRMHAPVVVARDGNYVNRLDGTHRTSVGRHLGIEKMLVVSVSEDEYARWVGERIDRNLAAAEMKRFEKWYQAIEVLPGLWTRPHRPEKEGAMLAALGVAEGRRVLDVGCNDGLYCFEAAARGARSVLGVDKRARTIQQAKFVQTIWNVIRPRSRIVEFRELDVRKEPTIFRDGDLIVLACVVYHMGDGLHRLMRMVAESPARTVIVQGNRGRCRRITAEEWDRWCRDGAADTTSSRVYFDLPQMDALFQRYGFGVTDHRGGSYPIAIYERKGNATAPV